MKKRKALFILALILFVCVSGCDVLNPVIDPWWEGSPQGFNRVIMFTHEAYVVSFDSGGGNYVDLINGGTTNAPPQRVLANAKATVPGLVVNGGDFFDGWYKEDGATKWNFDSNPVTEDMTLYAHWDGTGGHTVTFNLNFNGNGLSESDLVYTPETERIAHNALAAEPLQFGLKEGSPHFGDYVFSGWYEESSAATRYSFTTPVTADKTLYAGWAKMGTGAGEKPPSDVYAVRFVGNTDNKPPNQYILTGAKIVNPFVVFKSGNSFGGWYKNPDFSGAEWDFTNPVDGAYDSVNGVDGGGRKIVTLYAKWFPVDPVDIFKDLRILYFNYVLFAGGSTAYNQISTPGNASTLSNGDITANKNVIKTVIQLLEDNPTYRVMVIGHANPTTPEDHANPLNPSLVGISNGRVEAVKAQLIGFSHYNTTITPILTRSEGGRQALQDPALSRRGEIVVFDITTKVVTP